MFNIAMDESGNTCNSHELYLYMYTFMNRYQNLPCYISLTQRDF